MAQIAYRFLGVKTVNGLSRTWLTDASDKPSKLSLLRAASNWLVDNNGKFYMSHVELTDSDVSLFGMYRVRCAKCFWTTFATKSRRKCDKCGGKCATIERRRAGNLKWSVLDHRFVGGFDRITLANGLRPHAKYTLNNNHLVRIAAMWATNNADTFDLHDVQVKKYYDDYYSIRLFGVMW